MTTNSGNKGSSPTLLDSLRSRATGQPGSGENIREQHIRSSMDELLWLVHSWLEEVARYLTKLKPAVAHEFHFPPYLSFRALTLEESFVSYRRQRFEDQDLLEYIELFYRLRAPNNIIVQVRGEEADQIETRMRVAGLTFEVNPTIDQWQHVRNVQFNIQPEIRANIRIMPDYVKHNFGFRLSNIDRFEVLYMLFSPGQLEEQTLESLVQLILGENQEFMKLSTWLSHWRPTPSPHAPVFHPPRFIV